MMPLSLCNQQGKCDYDIMSGEMTVDPLSNLTDGITSDEKKDGGSLSNLMDTRWGFTSYLEQPGHQRSELKGSRDDYLPETLKCNIRVKRCIQSRDVKQNDEPLLSLLHVACQIKNTGKDGHSVCMPPSLYIETLAHCDGVWRRILCHAMWS